MAAPPTPSFPRPTADALVLAFSEIGLDAAAIRREAELDEGVDRVPATVWGALWGAARRRSDDPVLPSRVGLALPYGAFGLLDYLAGSAPTIDASLRTLATHMGAAASLVGMSWTPPSLEVVARSTAGADTDEFAAAVAVGRMRHVGGPAVVDRVLLNRPRVADGAHEALFGVPVRHDTARAGVDFAPELLDRAPSTADAALHASLRRTAAALGVGPGASALETRVRAVLPGLVAAGRSDAAHVASALGMSRRTLYRRLRDEGVRLAEIVDRYRTQEARRLLRTDAPLAAIATAIGYADQAAFTRAFKRWFGVTPGAWRADHIS